MSEDRDKMLFIHSSDELYGADRVLIDMIEALPPEIAVEVWLPNDLSHAARPLCEVLATRGIRVRHLDLPILRRDYRNLGGLIRLAARSVRLRRELKRIDSGTIYLTTSATFLAAPLARSLREHRVLGHIQEIWVGRDRTLLAIPALFCHEMIAISEAVRSSLPRRISARTRVLLNATRAPDGTTPLASHSGTMEFVVASRWNNWKGHRTLLSAWELAGAPGRLVVLGGPPLIGECVDVRQLVDELTDPDSVVLVGEVTDSAPYIDRADAVLVPSDQAEPFGLVAIEAFARGRPVIASAAGGLLEVITPGREGWLFPPRDSYALAELLGRLTRSEVVAAGDRARETFEERFTMQRLEHEWRSIVLNT